MYFLNGVCYWQGSTKHTQSCSVSDLKPIELKQHNGSVSDSVKCFTDGNFIVWQIAKTVWQTIDLSAKKHKMIAGIHHVLCRPCMYISVPNVSSAAIKDVAHVIWDICDAHVSLWASSALCPRYLPLLRPPKSQVCAKLHVELPILTTPLCVEK